MVVSAVIICAGLAIGLVALAELHSVPTGLSPISNPVSQYGITKYAIGYRIQTLAYAVAAGGAAAGIAMLPGSTAAVVALCAVFALARAAISWFPMDEPGSERTSTGRGHGVLAIIAFLAVTFAAQRLANLVNEDRIHPSIGTASNVLAAVMVVCLVMMVVDRRAGGGLFGLIERIFYLGMTAWLALVAVLLVVT